MNSTLYSLAREYAALFDAATDPESDSASFDAALADLSEEIRGKASGVAAVIRSVETLADAIEDALRAQRARLAALRAKECRLREYLLGCLTSAGINRIDTAEFRISVRKNPARVEVIDEGRLAEDYLITVTEKRVDKIALKKDLAAGKIIEGARLIAGERVEIN